MNWIDRFLNRTTMYRLAIEVLGGLLVVAGVLGALGIIPFSPLAIGTSVLLLLIVCWATNRIFNWAFAAPPHNSSAYITALILALILAPPKTVADLPVLAWAGVLAIASKYLLASRRQHIFNPAAFAVALTSYTLHVSATWWIGTKPLLPAVLIGAFLVIRKLQRADLFYAFLISAAATIIGFTVSLHTPLLPPLTRALTASPLIFFASIMLTEPLTMPATRSRRIAFAVLVGVLFAPPFHLGGIYLTPELALLTGNLAFFLLKPKARYALTLVDRRALGPDTYEFSFQSDRSINFKAGQYVELTLPHLRADARGERRFFTVASSPSERVVRFGVKFENPASTFKRALWAMKAGDFIYAAQVDGDFTLPRNRKQPLVFIAGGIGITPFRSMVAHLQHLSDRRPVTLLYSARTPEELSYRPFFERAKSAIGLRSLFTVTDAAPAEWGGRRGKLDARAVAEAVPNFRESRFYLSGPRGMVLGFERTLADMGIPRRNVRTDYFPGFA